MLQSPPVKFRNNHALHYSHPTVTVEIETPMDLAPEFKTNSPVQPTAQTGPTHPQNELLPTNGQPQGRFFFSVRKFDCFRSCQKRNRGTTWYHEPFLRSKYVFGQVVGNR